MLTDEDFESVKAEGVKTIDISDFVPYDEIDPIYFDRTYFLGPQDGAEKVYALMREAMEQTGLAAIGKYVMRERQYLGCLRVRDGVIALEKMFFHDEIRPSKDLAPGQAQGAERGARARDRADRAVHGGVQAGEVRGHLPQGADGGRPGEAEGEDDHGTRAGGRGGADRPARRAEGIRRRREEGPGLGAREAAAGSQEARCRRKTAKR